MSTMLTGDQFRKILKKLGELLRQVSQDEYPFDPIVLLLTLNALIEGKNDEVTYTFPSERSAGDLIPESYGKAPNVTTWSIISDSISYLHTSDAPLLREYPIFEDSEDEVSIRVCRARAVGQGLNRTLLEGKVMLGEDGKGNNIPTILQEKKLVLAGTMLVRRSPMRQINYIPFLYYTQDIGWRVNFVPFSSTISKKDGYVFVDPN